MSTKVTACSLPLLLAACTAPEPPRQVPSPSTGTAPAVAATLKPAPVLLPHRSRERVLFLPDYADLREERWRVYVARLRDNPDLLPPREPPPVIYGCIAPPWDGRE